MVEEEGETAVDDKPLASVKILHILQRAKADIEGLIAVAGTDPHDEANMLAENYAVQWKSMAILVEVNKGLGLELSQSSV